MVLEYLPNSEVAGWFSIETWGGPKFRANQPGRIAGSINGDSSNGYGFSMVYPKRGGSIVMELPLDTWMIEHCKSYWNGWFLGVPPHFRKPPNGNGINQILGYSIFRPKSCSSSWSSVQFWNELPHKRNKVPKSKVSNFEPKPQMSIFCWCQLPPSAATCPSPATGPRAIVPGPYIKGILWGWAQRTSSEWTQKGVLFYPFCFFGIIILISNKLKYGSIWNKPLRNKGPLFGIMVTIFLGSSFWHWPFLTHDQARVSIKPRSCGFLWSPIWLVLETPSTRDNDPWPTSKEFMSNPK